MKRAVGIPGVLLSAISQAAQDPKPTFGQQEDLGDELLLLGATTIHHRCKARLHRLCAAAGAEEFWGYTLNIQAMSSEPKSSAMLLATTERSGS